jgi:hypothetical protein
LWFYLILCFTLCPFVTKRGSIFCFGLGLYFLTGQVFLSQNDQRESLLVCNWLHSVGQNHFHNEPFYQGFSLFSEVFLSELCF